ncbi:MAG TPA: endonuclease [Leeuwenhoekiella sp.]|nr:endonuclease [Leeuwenhoekiella sp.]
MKSLSFLNKIVFFVNGFAAFLLLTGYLLPFIPPRIFPEISVLTLGLPFLILGNLVFVTYWLFQLKKQFLLSAFILALGFFQEATLYEFFGNSSDEQGSFKVMSFNVRMFNFNGALKEKDIPEQIENLIYKEDPDIVSFQEYTDVTSFKLEGYKYKYIKLQGDNSNFGLAIYSKYAIINKGSLDFPDSMNNAIFIDILKEKDTLRVYNLHMQTLTLEPQIGNLRHEDSQKLLGRLGQSFKKQQEQTELVLAHQAKCKYTMIVNGDFNNTAYSYAYSKIRGDKKDAFEEAGSGFGRTFIFDFIPIRIDFMLVNPSIEVLDFYNYEQELSDHYPIMAKLKL